MTLTFRERQRCNREQTVPLSTVSFTKMVLHRPEFSRSNFLGFNSVVLTCSSETVDTRADANT